jgi:hypothetical protein
MEIFLHRLYKGLLMINGGHSAATSGLLVYWILGLELGTIQIQEKL